MRRARWRDILVCGIRYWSESGAGGQESNACSRHYDEPFADSSAIPSLALARALAGRYKVVLNGDGGDEVFGGYGTTNTFASSRPSRQLRLRWVCAMADGPAERECICNRRYVSRCRARPNIEWAGPGNSLDGVDVFDSSGSALKGAMWIDRHLALANGLNYKTDIAYGAFGIEGRAPFLDHRLGAWAGACGSKELVRGREKKIMLRAAYAGICRAEILNRPKQGFGAPIERWLRGPLRELAGDMLPCPLLDRELQERRSGQQRWTLLMFARWTREWKASW